MELLFKASKVDLRLSVTLFGGKALPADDFLEVFGDAIAGAIHRAELILYLGIALIGGFAIPAGGFLWVFVAAPATFVHLAKSEPRNSITLLGKRLDARYLG